MQHKISWLLPLLFLVVLAPLTPVLDITIEKYFFDSNQFSSSIFLNTLYTYGLIPGWCLALASLIIYILSFFFSSWKTLRIFALLPLLTVTFGAGLIIDKTLKEHWGRPRPKQTIEFGGTQPYRPFYHPNFSNPEPSKSFPSGHVSMGFVFFSLAFVARRLEKNGLFFLSLLTTFILGGLLGYARMAQGGHYFSDVLMSALIMWWTALFFDWWIFEKKRLHEVVDQKTI